MSQTTPAKVTVGLALLIWGVSASSNWDYRFSGSSSPRHSATSSRINSESSASSKTLYSEAEGGGDGGGEVLQGIKNRENSQENNYRIPEATNKSRTNTIQATRHVSVISEGGGSDKVYIGDKNSSYHSVQLRFQNGENDGDVSNSTFRVDASSVNRGREGVTVLSRPQALQSLNKPDASKESKSPQQSSTALAVVGRSLDDHPPESAPRSDAVSSYYDFLVNEGSYKFWSVFQVFTAALLIYSAFAAVYYAKYTFATMDYPDYLDDGFFFRRTGGERAQGDDMYYDDEDYDVITTTARPQQSTFLGMSSATFQRIMDALSSKKYS